MQARMAFVAESAVFTGNSVSVAGFQQLRMPPLPGTWKAVNAVAVVTVPVP